MPSRGALGDAPAISCRAQTNLDEMTGKKKTRTKRGTQSNIKRLRNRRRVRRQNRRAGRKLEDWCAANLNWEERVSVGSGSDPLASHNRIMNRKKEKEIKE